MFKHIRSSAHNRFYTTVTVGTLWTMLGAKRGADLYEYEKPLYSDKYLYACTGSFIYMNPTLLLLIVSKELYRIKVIMNGLEKNMDYYELI